MSWRAAARVLVCCVVTVVASRGEARAAGEDAFQLSLRLGGANATGNPLGPWGATAALDAEYGLDDAWSARASVGVLRHPVAAVKNVSPAGTRQGVTALVGGAYVFDVLRLVPYIELGVGVVHWSGPGAPSHDAFAAELGLGGDYLLTRWWALGGSAQYLFAPDELAQGAMSFGGPALAFSATLRVSRIF